MNKTSNFNIINLIRLAWEKRTVLIIVTILAGIISTIYSFMIPEKYKASAVIFPTTESTVTDVLNYMNSWGPNPLFRFGEDMESEQLLQVLESEKIRIPICEKYNLFEHYEIDPDTKDPSGKLFKEYYKNVSFKKTPYYSIEIVVEDTDPQMAADIANDIVALADSVQNDLRQNRAKSFLGYFEKIHTEYAKEIGKLESDLNEMNKSDLLNGGIQELLGYYIKMGYFERMNVRYNEILAEATAELSYSFVVHSARKPDYKFYPKKSLIILSSMFATFVFALMVIIFQRTIKNYMEE